MKSFCYGKGKSVIAFIALQVLLTAFPVYAAVPPTSGSLIQEQAKPPIPQKQAPAVEVGKEKSNTSSEAGAKIQVKEIKITGQTVFADTDLLPLISPAFGKELTLAELEAVAGSVTAFYHQQGYPVANAIIPEQDIKDGVVEIQIIVGRYGKINLHNQSGMKTETAMSFISSLKSGEYVKSDILERALLLLNDTAGVSAKATLAPGKESGTADLLIDLADTAKTNAQVTADNWGNRFTGANRIGLNMNINNPGAIGDLANLGFTYSGEGMNNYNLSYLLPIGGQGTKFGFGFSQLHYTLGETYASLDASGVAKTATLFTSFEITRSRNVNLTGRFEYAKKRLTDSIDVQGFNSKKQADVWTFSLTGNSTDQFGGGGATGFALSFSQGRLDPQSADAVADADTAKTAGGYGKINLNLNRAQAIDNRVSLYLSFSGQLANKNLDSSEKLQIGGPSGVRAYPVGEASADEGYLFSSELRWNLPTPQFQLAAFFDSGRAILSNTRVAGAGANKRILSGAGLGLRWNQANDFSIRLDYAWKTTNDPATSDTDKNGRLWLQGVKYY